MTLGLIGVFTAGLLTFFTPCVLPLIPIYLSALIGGDIRQMSRMEETGRGQLLFRAVLFSIGFIIVFTLMGLTASSLGSFLGDHKGVLEAAGAFLILVFGLKFLGVLRIPFFDRIVRADDTRMQTRFGGVNALVMGVVFAAGWSPCVGPVLGSVLTYTASQASDPITGAAYLTLYGLGFAIPLLITATFAEVGVRALRRINPYLPKIERGIGIFLVLMAASLLFDLAMEAQSAAPENRNAVLELVRSEEGEPWPAMVEFYSKNCPICQRMKPTVDGLANECNGNRVLVRAVDVSEPENGHFSKRFRLVGVPTFLFLDREGGEVARLVGEQTERSLKQALSALRGEPCPGLAFLDGETLQFPEMDDAAVSCEMGGTEHAADAYPTGAATSENCEGASAPKTDDRP